MLYLAFRWVVTWLLKAFYRLETVADPHHALALKGPVIFVANHPNGLVDPGMILMLARRKVTFLAKAPLFKMPVIGSLVRRPGAFARWVYREEMFPTVMFRRAYDALSALGRGVHADREYLRVLHLAATTMECEVNAALELLLAGKEPPTADAVRRLVENRESSPVPVIELGPVDLTTYDRYLEEMTT